MIKKKISCIIDFYIRILTRVVAIWFKMETILLIKQFHTCDGFSFTSVSTYLQNNRSGCPSSNRQCVRIRASQMGSNTPLCSHGEAIVSQGLMGILPLLWQPVGLQCWDGRQTEHPGTTCSLYNDGIFHKHLQHFRVNAVVQTLQEFLPWHCC